MTEEELERLKRRFGSDIAVWPAPHRLEAQIFLAGRSQAKGPDNDAHLERIILEASLEDTDERTLARMVLERIDQERRPVFPSLTMPSLLRFPAFATGLAAILVAAGVGGYLVAGAKYGKLDDVLLALAAGDPIIEGMERGYFGSYGGSFDKEDLL